MKSLVNQKLVRWMSGVMVMLSLSSCDGLFSHIYDEPLSEDNQEYGFIEIDENTHTGRIYIDATDYKKWHYIDLKNKQVITAPVTDASPQRWDFAVHRYDAKTHGGTVFESKATDFGSVPDVNMIPSEAFVADQWTTDKITMDISQMMDGIIVYAEDYYNACLSQWLNVNTSSMPPVYTLSGKVYVLKLADGTCAALRLSNFMNDAAVKGFMSIDYLYPIEL